MVVILEFDKFEGFFFPSWLGEEKLHSGSKVENILLLKHVTIYSKNVFRIM